MNRNWEFFLGGQDLEMVTIRQLLEEAGCRYHDNGLTWGARASAYLEEIEQSVSQRRTPVLVELEPDIPRRLVDAATIVDHHGDRAGSGVPSSLEQTFRLLELPASRWDRYLELVAANDRGHIRGMRQLSPPATDVEVRMIRQRDLGAQGVTEQDLAAARAAAATAEVRCGGRLTFVRTDSRAGLVAEMLEPFFGGPGFVNLLVTGARQASFFGEGRWVQRLAEASPSPPSSWFGGALPEFGFWGAVPSELEFDPLALLESLLSSESGGV